VAYGIVNADVIGTSVAGSNLGAGNASIMKNRIINGAMVIDQRNAGAAVTIDGTAGTYTLDRWLGIDVSTGSFTVQQDSTAPAGFVNSSKLTVASIVTSYGTTNSCQFMQRIEGYNLADLGWGTANAKTVTLSFWVYSSLTGTFGGAIKNSESTRSYPYSYTISSANTWEQKTITIAGDTTGTWVTTNGIGAMVIFCLGGGTDRLGTAGAWNANNNVGAIGQVNVMGTLSANIYITGVQLEVGSSATGFEYVNYQTSLANCQRYYQLSSRYEENVIGLCTTTTTATAPVMFAQVMRASPTMTLAPAGSTAGCISFLTGGATPAVIGTHSAISITNYGFRISASGYTAASWAIGVATNLYAYTNPTTVYTASAEL
jgi:hypothetical protein